MAADSTNATRLATDTLNWQTVEDSTNVYYKLTKEDTSYIVRRYKYFWNSTDLEWDLTETGDPSETDYTAMGEAFIGFLSATWSTGH